MGNWCSKASTKHEDEDFSTIPAMAEPAMGTPNPLGGMHLDSTKLKKSDFDFGDKLGSGQYADVFRAVYTATGVTYAIKQMNKSKMKEEEIKGLSQEIDILHEVNHDHIMNLYGSFEGGGFVYLVTEELKGGELFDRIVAHDPPHYSEKTAQSTVRMILEAIAYLHGKGICHRDLKPENLLLQSMTDDKSCKIADFGFAAKPSTQPKGVLTDGVGTPGYVAPEIISSRNGHGLPCDIWSMGTIVYILICGYPPFYHEDDKKLFSIICKGKYSYDKDDWAGISNLCKDFINKMLVVDVNKRWTAEQLLQHEWMTSAELSDEHRDAALQKIKSMQAKKRWKKAGQTVLATVKFQSLLKSFAEAAAAAE